MDNEPTTGKCRRIECTEPAQTPGPFCPAHRQEHARDVLADLQYWARRDIRPT